MSTRRGRGALLCLCLLLFVSATARAVQNAHLMWYASPDQSAVGYILWYGGASHTYTNSVDVGTNLATTISGLADGQTYYFVVTAYNQAGVQSPPSNEAAFVAPSAVPAPRVSVLSPGSGAPGTQVYIYGSGFTGATNVQFGGVSAAFTISADSSLVATVPAGAAGGSVTIRTPGGTGTGQFTVVAQPAPANDNFANAQVLSGVIAAVSASNTNATKEAGEPGHAGNAGGGSIWYRWTAPYAGTWTLDTSGSDFTALLAVYTGGSVGGLAVVASNAVAGGFTNLISFNAAAGATYNIAVDGLSNARGNVALRLAPVLSTTTLVNDTFESAQGFSTLLPLAGQDGWTGNFSIGSGIVVNNFAGYGQQGSVGFLSVALSSNPLLVYKPLNNLVDTTTYPVVHFSVLMQIDNLHGHYGDTYGWSVRNKTGHELFALTFNCATAQISYNLDNGAGPVSTGTSYAFSTMYALNITMDFSSNRWTANFNGANIVTQQPMTTTGAALTLGDIDAKTILASLLSPGVDGMVFDNYVVTASPSAAPHLLSTPQNQSVTTGANVLLSASASGAQPMGCQWYLNSASIAGATNYTLLLKQVTASQGGTYSIVITNGSGSASAQAVVTAAVAPASARLGSASFLGTSRGTLNVGVAAGYNYHLQASTNLVNWTNLCGFYAAGTNVLCLDPDAASFNRRFYRIVSP